MKAAVSDSLTTELYTAIADKNQYDAIKNKRIANLKKTLADADFQTEYQINDRLYNEFKKYKIDSAIIFIRRNIQLSEALNNKSLQLSTIIKLANLYSSTGKFIEAQNILSEIKSKELSLENRSLYFQAFSRFYEHYTTNNANKEYKRRIEIYRDSLLSTLPENSVPYRINLAQKNIYQHDYKRAKILLDILYKNAKIKDSDYAMITYLLGDLCKYINKPGQEERFYKIAALTDIKNSIKDNAAMQSLAVISYNNGDLEQAYKFTQSAIDDAFLCNVKFRTLSISELYSIINSNYLEKVAHSKSQLIIYLVMISILTVFLVIITVFLRRQIKKNAIFRKELILNTEKLEELNTKIQNSNITLKEKNQFLNESNRIKEEYIAQFFDMCSSYINKLEDFRKILSKKAQNRDFETLAKELRSTTVATTELDTLYHTFDTIFVNLYPNFIKEFNELLIPEEQIILKPNEILNTELRVFALIRLGINDSVKIAAFLRYSLSTIYNYRTKARNKSIVSREEFDLRLLKIGMLTQDEK